MGKDVAISTRHLDAHKKYWLHWKIDKYGSDVTYRHCSGIVIAFLVPLWHAPILGTEHVLGIIEKDTIPFIDTHLSSIDKNSIGPL